MARKYFDNVRHLITTTGDSDIVFGAVPTGWRGADDAGAVDGDQVPYELREGANWENGWFTISGSVSGGSRVVEDSSNGGDPIVLAGAAVFTITLNAGVIGLLETEIADRLGTEDIDTDVTLAANSDSKVASQKAVKAYVDGKVLDLRKSASAVVMDDTDSNPASSGYTNGATIDGQSVSTGDYVLRNSSSHQERNGLWKVAASGGASRVTEYDTYDEYPGSIVSVQNGTYGDTVWLCTSNVGGTLNTTAIVYGQMRINGELLAANNLSDVANASTARGNLGLGTAAVENIGTSGANVPKMNGNNTFSGRQTFTDYVTIQRAIEKGNIIADNPASGDNNIDIGTSSIHYFTTNTDTNFGLNIRHSSGSTLNSYMADADVLSLAVIVTNGATPYFMNSFKIDGSAVTPQWLGSPAPDAGTPSKRDTYTFTIIKTGSGAFDVQASFAGGN